jgi:endonuclease YncB( thermonuclease family)
VPLGGEPSSPGVVDGIRLSDLRRPRCFSYAPEHLSGKVVGVTDGDTLTVLVDREPVKVRLAEIDTGLAVDPHPRPSVGKGAGYQRIRPV